ncbi:MAG: DUF3786 domain-containing protein [Candidatus Bipolaricaulaceae bacterium]
MPNAVEIWRQSLLPRISEAKNILTHLPLAELARRSGAIAKEGGLELEFLGKKYFLSQDLTFFDPQGKPAPEEVQAILFDYLVNADGTRPSGEWVGFGDLPHGSFYQQAFQSYSGDELVRRLSLPAFRRAAEAAGGIPLPLGDAGYAFPVLPLLPLAVVWWEGEEGLPPKAVVLFDARASRLLPAEGLAIVGRLLCRWLIKLGGG